VKGLAHADVALLEIEHDTVAVESTPVWHPQLARAGRRRRTVAVTAFETDRVHDAAIALLNHYDLVVVPSEFNATALRASGLARPACSVPHPARPAAVKEREAGGPFVFYTIASWTTRKAVLETVDAFVRAFTAADEVELVVHTTAEDLVALARLQRSGRSFSRREVSSSMTLARFLAGRGDVPAIRLSTRVLDTSGIAALHRRGDCYVSLSRGEGWGLGAFEAVAHGKPVVVTGWGGTLEFLPADYPYLVGFDLVPTTAEPLDAWWVPHPGERWAKADVDHAASLLRQVFERRDEAGAWGRRLAGGVGERYDPAAVTRQLLAALETVAVG
jgi:glycosyltransferase involved in cell wall biosynthesis